MALLGASGFSSLGGCGWEASPPLDGSSARTAFLVGHAVISVPLMPMWAEALSVGLVSFTCAGDLEQVRPGEQGRADQGRPVSAGGVVQCCSAVRLER